MSAREIHALFDAAAEAMILVDLSDAPDAESRWSSMFADDDSPFEGEVVTYSLSRSNLDAILREYPHAKLEASARRCYAFSIA